MHSPAGIPLTADSESRSLLFAPTQPLAKEVVNPPFPTFQQTAA